MFGLLPGELWRCLLLLPFTSTTTSFRATWFEEPRSSPSSYLEIQQNNIKNQDDRHFIVILILQRKEFSSRLRHLDICCCSDHRLNLSVFRGQSVRNLGENVIPKLILYQVGMFLSEKQRQFRESLFVMRFLVEDFVNNLQSLLSIDIKTGFIKQGNQEPFTE